ncbi:MAG TPA: ABC transporter permease [Candidatus Didemnitutus sp.]|nr:ABC transporter permease [Candidatus Didemnitutus sp.]
MLADVKFALRSLAKAPAMPVLAILTLALGIGSVTISFSALNTLLLKPLPFIQHEERMLWINEAVPSKGVDSTDIAYADFREWRQRCQTLATIWLYDNRTIILSGTEEPERVLGAGLTAGAFQAMGVQPEVGRNFRDEECDPNAAPVALISHGLWQRHFGGKAVVGRVVNLNGRATTIVGIMPNGWRYPETADVWVPLTDQPAAAHADFEYSGHAMLKPGVTLEQARAEMAQISAAIAREFPATNTGLEVVLRPVREEATDDTRPLTLLLFGAVLFVFLIACANVANLVLARASARTKEIALRLALGASRGRIVRQLLLESLILALLGGLGGLLVASWGADLLLAAIPVELPFWIRLGFDPILFGFTFGLSLLSCVLFGLVPALQASRPDQIEEIKEGGRTATGGARGHRLRHALVVLEVALALVLLVGAGLMARSFSTLQKVDPGFDSHRLLTFRVGFPEALGGSKDSYRQFYRQLEPKLASLPGVESVGATSALPALGQGGYSPLVFEGQPQPANLADAPVGLTRIVTPGFFATMKIALVAGRLFNANDDLSHPLCVIVDEEFARRFFPNTDPAGKRFRHATDEGEAYHWFEVVGVVRPVRRWIDRDEPVPTFYRPFEQTPDNFMSVVLRVHGDPNLIAPAARKAVLSINKGIPIYNVLTMDNALDRAAWTRRAFSSYFSAFAGLALFLAMIGIYGVMSYSVAQRTHEIGIRIALGAESANIIGLVVARGLRLVLMGVAAGLAAAYPATRLLASSLYGVAPHDLLTFVAVPLVLAAVAIAACFLPARRALRVDPIVALRSE